MRGRRRLMNTIPRVHGRVDEGRSSNKVVELPVCRSRQGIKVKECNSSNRGLHKLQRVLRRNERRNAENNPSYDGYEKRDVT